MFRSLGRGRARYWGGTHQRAPGLLTEFLGPCARRSLAAPVSLNLGRESSEPALCIAVQAS